ncbi:MAG: hypothetical protein JST82_05985 [Bacteroidetes bacterium]|nr:hypothetical protein [Bacteroidota bacterium]
MRNRFLITGILAVMLVVSSFNNADARGWGRWHCRPHRVFLAPPIPRIVVPAPVFVPRPRYYGGYGYYGRPRHCWHRGYGRRWRY